MAVRKLRSKPDAVYFATFTCHQWLGAVEAQDKLTPAVMEKIAKVLDNEPARPMF